MKSILIITFFTILRIGIPVICLYLLSELLRFYDRRYRRSGI